MLVVSFVALIGVGGLVLSLPVAGDEAPIGFGDAVFLSTSAVTVTGLASFDIGELSLLGELIVLALIQVGGFGIMTIGTVVGVVTARRLGLRQRMLARAEIGSIEMGEVRQLVVSILRITVVIEGAIAVALAVAFGVRGVPAAEAAYEGLYLSVSAFNNAGILPSAEGMMAYTGDAFVVGITSLAIILGGLGFPVIIELLRRVRPRRWSLHTKLVLAASGALLVAGPILVGLFEWTNPRTLGALGVEDKVLAAWFQGVSPRTAGFATVDIGALNDPTLLVMTALMFIGAGPASTGGGIRVTTFALLGFVLWSVVRGDADTHAFRRRIPDVVVRQSIASVLLAIGAVIGATLMLLAVTDFTLMQMLFEATSAFGTAGLSMGVTANVGEFGHIVLMLLMLIGRVGPITVVAALAMRERPRLYRYPEERPIVG